MNISVCHFLFSVHFEQTTDEMQIYYNLLPVKPFYDFVSLFYCNNQNPLVSRILIFLVCLLPRYTEQIKLIQVVAVELYHREKCKLLETCV